MVYEYYILSQLSSMNTNLECPSVRASSGLAAWTLLLPSGTFVRKRLCHGRLQRPTFCSFGGWRNLSRRSLVGFTRSNLGLLRLQRNAIGEELSLLTVVLTVSKMILSQLHKTGK